MQKILCSVAGLGRIASLLEDDRLREKPATHTGAIMRNRECSLLSGCDPDPERRDHYAKKWNCRLVFPDIETLLACQTPDILCIATPPDSHKTILEKAVQHGVPVIICEKPLALNVTEAREMVETAGQGKSVLIVNHERRYSMDYTLVNKLIREKTYGTLSCITGKLFMGRNKRVKDMLFDDATHMIDIIRFLTDEELSLVQVSGDLNKKAGSAMILLKSGDADVLINAACNRDYLEFQLDLDFTHGRIVVGNGIYEEYGSVQSPYYEEINSLKKIRSIKFKKTGYFSGMLEDAVKVFKNQQEKPVSSGMDGLKAVELLQSIVSA
ncbi:MAG: Gfo/Idh/MocA family oxidoreductase [Spirochaetales bacterium]|nr:Gfo/Idh/MocA family oxidoreductase [Spirochaetales bacterium]